MKRIPQLCTLAALALLVASCGGNSTLDDTESAVVLTVEIDEYNPDIDICQSGDVVVASMNVNSAAKAPIQDRPHRVSSFAHDVARAIDPSPFGNGLGNGQCLPA